MSFREIRNLVEHLRLLGFSRLVSLENFSSPNFQLVSEILTWTMMTVDSDYDLPTNIDSEQDRVIMVRLAAIFFYQKLGVRLNTVKLYGADKLAVQELLKITKSLCEATQLAVYPAVVSEEALPVQTDFSAAVSVKELREVRQLASNIVMDAASLSSILQREVDDKIKRVTALDQTLDMDTIEASVVAALHAVAGTIADIKEATESVAKEGEEIQEKILKKKLSFTRNQKRLEALQKIKPAWQLDFDREEAQLSTVWDEYITRHKNLDYLEEQLEQLQQQHHHQLQQQHMDAASKKGINAATSGQSLSGIMKSNIIKGQEASGNVFGTMTGDDIDSSDSSDSIDSFLVDSESGNDSLTLMSAADTAGMSLQQTTIVREEISKAPLSWRPPSTYPSLSRPASTKPSLCHSTARPKSSQVGMRASSLTAWTSVRGSGRVSPLSVSDDNSDDAF